MSVLAVDIGGTKLATAVVNAAGAVSGRMVTPTVHGQSSALSLRALLAQAEQSLALSSGSGVSDMVDAVGIACGGPLDITHGRVLSPPNLPDWKDVAVVDAFAAHFGLPARLHNDASAAAWGEALFQTTARARDLAYLTVSTGVGGGVVVDGRLLAGERGNAVEIGHMVVEVQGRLCDCGRRGCLEAYASGTSIARRARERPSLRTSTLAEEEVITADAVARAALAGDPLAADVWGESMHYLGEGLANVVNLFEPAVVVVGGGVAGAGDQLLAPITARVRASAMREGKNTPIMLSAAGPDAGLLGAAAIAIADTREGLPHHDL